MSDVVEATVLSVLLGRQPIVDRAGALVAYELLFRGNAATNAAVVTDDHAATEEVILNAITQFGVAVALGSHRGFVNIGRTSLGSDSLLLLKPERFTLEILENVVIDAEVEAACVRLRQAGFQIALDDVVEAELPALIHRSHAAGCVVLAEKVETQDEFRRVLALGADLFQGYFFARPEILRQGRVSASQTSLLKLHRMLAEDPSLEELTWKVKRNPVLLAQLMKFAGSAHAAGRSDLTVGEAIARVGTRQLSRLAQLLLFACDGQRHLEDNPLLQLVHTRARFMELMAQERWPDDDVLADAAFQAGIFSLMHVVTRQTSEEMLAQMGTGPRIEAAILRSEGRLGDLLLIAQLMEGFKAVEPTDALSRCGVASDRLNELFVRAMQTTISTD